MNNIVLKKLYSEPEICEKEILRYAGCKSANASTLELMRSCVEEARQALTYRVCYCTLDVEITENICDFGLFKVKSKNLAENLNGCRRVVLFAATVGTGIDRLIMKYTELSPSRAVMLQAIGAERAEALCDAFCDDLREKYKCKLKPRFSAGYGDLPLECQKEIFTALNCSKHIGIFLNESLLMSPSKSVTAFVGLYEGDETDIKMSKCENCDKCDCAYRGV